MSWDAISFMMLEGVSATRSLSTDGHTMTVTLTVTSTRNGTVQKNTCEDKATAASEGMPHNQTSFLHDLVLTCFRLNQPLSLPTHHEEGHRILGIKGVKVRNDKKKATSEKIGIKSSKEDKDIKGTKVGGAVQQLKKKTKKKAG